VKGIKVEGLLSKYLGSESLHVLGVFGVWNI
jgi:hypothetical protein